MDLKLPLLSRSSRRLLQSPELARVRAWLEAFEPPQRFVLANNPIARVIRLKGSPLVEVCLRAMDRKGHVREYWQRMFVTGHRATVHVIALSSDGCVVINREYRVNNNLSFHTAASGVKKEGESAVQAGVRELREESGWVVSETSQIFTIGTFAPHGAILTLLEDIVVVTDVVHDEAPHDPEDGEFILGVEALTLDRIFEILRDNIDMFHAPTLAALLHAMACGFLWPSEEAHRKALQARSLLRSTSFDPSQQDG